MVEGEDINLAPAPLPLSRTKSWKEYDGNDEIPMILSEGLLPVKFQGAEFQELDYEGALRFYYEDGQNELTKAVRLTNRTSVYDLLPVLVEKFSIPSDNNYALYEGYETGDFLQLTFEECPLARAISKQKVPKFILKQKDENGNTIYPETVISFSPSESPSKRKSRLFSFAAKEKRDEEKSEKKANRKSQKSKSKKVKEKGIAKVPSNTEFYTSASGKEEEIEEAVSEQITESAPLISFDNLTESGFFDSVSQSSQEDFQQQNTEPKRYVPLVSPASSAEDIRDAVIVVQNAGSEVDEPLFEEVTKQEVHAEIDDHLFDDEDGDLDEEKVRTLSFSNSSIFFDQDNDNNKISKEDFVNRRNRKKSQKKEKKVSRKKSNSERGRGRSLSKMLKGQKKKNASKDATLELSTNKLAPGILKIFGDHVSEGSNYKAVRVSTISTAQEVVKMALERYGFENANPRDYVLCDVVGTFEQVENQRGSKRGKSKPPDEEEQPKWTTEYIRAINDYEKPLVLQSLWKPTNGRYRRFELRKRVDVENSLFFINTADGMGRSNSETSLFNDSDSLNSGNDNTSHNEKSIISDRKVNGHGDSFKSDQTNSQSEGRNEDLRSNQAPLYVPYLLLLHGKDHVLDKLVHKLVDPTNVVGPYMENESKQCNIVLHSNDILLPHCWIYKKVKIEGESSETNLDEINFSVYVEPASGADILVNGSPITSNTLLKPGHLVSFGRDYLFLFKDPTQELDLTLGILSNIKSNNIGRYEMPIVETEINETESANVEAILSDQTDESEGESIDSADDFDEISRSEKQLNLASRKKVEKSKLQLKYDIKQEDDILHAIIDVADEDLGAFKLTPAYFFMMVVEHSAATFTEIQTRKLLLKISSGLQGIAWEKTKEIGKQSSVKEDNPMTILSRVLPELKPVLFWMASALEMLHYLQCNLDNYLLPREQVTTTKEALLSADEELLTVLEEVIMFTFQQTVYHLTKVLYAALPSVLESNPFLGNDKQRRVDVSVTNITEILSEVLNAAKEHQVHPQIISQLFAYLFFFSNASLFNSLMEKGPGREFYNWSKGTQIRGNLDVLEDWVQSNGLRKQFEQYMKKFLCAVDLLSVPKAQLLQFEWKTMRQDYSALNPAQLQQLLGEYELGQKARPRGWYPPPDEVEPALRSSEVLESFATHPPLILPSSGFIIDLNKTPDSDEFYKNLITLKEKFENVDDNEGGKPVPRLEPLKGGDDAKRTKKTRADRRGSSVNMIEVEEAIQMKNESTVESAPPNSSDEEQSERVPAIKSISVNSKKTTVTIHSHANSTVANTKPKSILVNGSAKHDREPSVDTLVRQARTLITASDDDDDDADSQLDGYKNGDEDVFVVTLERSTRGLGLGLIDGNFTALGSNGIYIRTIVPNTPAAEESRLRIGDQILAVNDKTLVGSNYNSAMDIIKRSGNKLKFLIAKSDNETTTQVLKSV